VNKRRCFPIVYRLRLHEEGDRRGSIPRPSLEPQSDVTRYSAYSCVRQLGLFMGFLAILGHRLVRCVPACTSPVAVRLQ
jgi:hypothetical protein